MGITRDCDGAGKGGDGILRIIGEHIARRGTVCRVTVVEVEGRSELPGASQPLEPAEMGHNLLARWFSELEGRVLLALCAEPTLTREEIGQRLGEDPEGHLKHVLRNLKNRYLLDSSNSGWTLLVPPGTDHAEYRKELCAFVLQHCPDLKPDGGQGGPT